MKGDLGSIPRLGRSPGRGHGIPLQYSCLENPLGQRNLAGYSPWGHKESEITEQLSPAQSLSKKSGSLVVGQLLDQLLETRIHKLDHRFYCC